jgi:hypothetical protein
MSHVIAFLVFGILALGLDRQIADAMNQIGSALGESLPKDLRWPTVLPPWSDERFENCLFFVRWWGAAMAVQGVVLALLVLLH